MRVGQYRVGQYVYHRLTEEERQCLRTSLASADGRDEDDGFFLDLANAGFAVPWIEGKNAADEQAISMVEVIAKLRLAVESHRYYVRVIGYVAEGKSRKRLMSLIAEASGIPDEDVFDLDDEDEDAEFTVVQALHDHFERQAKKLSGNALRAPYLDAHARPGLHLFQPDDPVFDEPEQLRLPGIPDGDLP